MDKQEYAKCIEDDIDFLKRHLPESLFKCLWTGHIIEVLKASINMLYDQPSFPSDLDKAARKSAVAPFNFEIDEEHIYEYPYLPIAEQKFKEGAEWMAGQGETFKEVPVYISYGDEKEINLTIVIEGTSLEFLETGDKVIVQIRKKD